MNGVAPQMQIDMTQLRLREDLMEHNGITLPANSRGTPQPYVDIGAQPPRPGLFQHTATSHRHISPISAEPLDLPTPTADARQANAGFTSAHHPLVEQYLAALQAGDEQAARAASMAFATPERWQQNLADAEQRILARQQELPCRDNPLFAQAMTQL